jgi:hypothetical protein
MSITAIQNILTNIILRVHLAASLNFYWAFIAEAVVPPNAGEMPTGTRINP